MFWVTYRQLFHTSLKKQSTCFSGRSVVTTSDWPNVSLSIILLVVISDFYLTHNKAEAVYYTVIRHAGNLSQSSRERKNTMSGSVFYFSGVFSNILSVLSS